MKSRTRTRGVDGLLAYRQAVPPSHYSSFEIRVDFTRKSVVYPQILGVSDLSIPDVGVFVNGGLIPLPNFIPMGSAGYYAPVLDDGYLSSLEAIIYPQLSERIWEIRNSGTIPFLEIDTLQRMTDVVGSGFVSNQGRKFIVNPCSSVKRTLQFPTSTSSSWEKTVTCSQGSVSSYYGYFTVVVTISMVTSGLTIGLPETLAHQIQSDVASLKLASGESTFQDAFSRVSAGEVEALTMLAESNKTVRYLANRLRNMAEILVKAKRAVLKLDANAAADLWLEARYAIRPIMYDVENTIRAMSKDSLSKTQTFRASAREEGSFQRTYSVTYDDTTYKVDADFGLLEKHTAGVYTRLRFDLPSVHTFGLTNFAQTAWELIPFSFVIDWFVNISGFLSSINPTPIYSIENGFLATKRVTLASCVLTVTRGEQTETRHFVYQFETYSRDKKLEPSFFNIDLNLSVPKLVDLLALAKRLI